MKRKRSVASYRAASLKAARTRRRMETARRIERGLKLLKENDDELYYKPRPTIDRVPKVEWRW